MPGVLGATLSPVSQGESYLEGPSVSPWKLRWEGTGPDEVLGAARPGMNPVSSSLQWGQSQLPEPPCGCGWRVEAAGCADAATLQCVCVWACDGRAPHDGSLAPVVTWLLGIAVW